jgi:transposase
MQTLHIGVDVAKEEVVMASATGPMAPHAVANERSALTRWLRSLPPGARIGLEATSHYHWCLADLAHALGFTVYVLNPRDTRHYARAVGARAKTDRVDAELIARFIAHEETHLRAYRPASETERAIDQLLRRRAKLTALKGALRMTLRGLPALKAEAVALTKRLDVLIARLDAMLQTRIASEPAKYATQQRLQSIVSVGPLVSAGLGNTLDRVRFRSADAFIAFLGWDPRACDSGEHRGKRRLSKRGPAELRRLLFNAAMSGVKTKAWGPIYQRYRARGFSSTEALVILARKIARTAWSLHRHGTTFDPNRITQVLT